MAGRRSERGRLLHARVDLEAETARVAAEHLDEVIADRLGSFDVRDELLVVAEERVVEIGRRHVRLRAHGQLSQYALCHLARRVELAHGLDVALVRLSRVHVARGERVVLLMARQAVDGRQREVVVHVLERVEQLRRRVAHDVEHARSLHVVEHKVEQCRILVDHVGHGCRRHRRPTRLLALLLLLLLLHDIDRPMLRIHGKRAACCCCCCCTCVVVCVSCKCEQRWRWWRRRRWRPVQGGDETTLRAHHRVHAHVLDEQVAIVQQLHAIHLDSQNDI